jgi:hypothetical protein
MASSAATITPERVPAHYCTAIAISPMRSLAAGREHVMTSEHQEFGGHKALVPRKRLKSMKAHATRAALL